MPDRPPGNDFHGDPEWYVQGTPPGEKRPRTPHGIMVDCYPKPFGLVCCPGKAMPEWLYLHLRRKTGIATQLPDVVPLRVNWSLAFGEYRANLTGIGPWDAPDIGTHSWQLVVRCQGGFDPPCKGWTHHGRLFPGGPQSDGPPVTANGPCTCDRIRVHFVRDILTATGGPSIGSYHAWLSEWQDPALDPGIEPIAT